MQTGGLYVFCARLAPAFGLGHCIRKCTATTGREACVSGLHGLAKQGTDQAFVPRHGNCEPRNHTNGPLGRIEKCALGGFLIGNVASTISPSDHLTQGRITLGREHKRG
jgi:hypothetical protein